jgi:hypothetical protein
MIYDDIIILIYLKDIKLPMLDLYPLPGLATDIIYANILEGVTLDGPSHTLIIILMEFGRCANGGCVFYLNSLQIFVF